MLLSSKTISSLTSFFLKITFPCLKIILFEKLVRLFFSIDCKVVHIEIHSMLLVQGMLRNHKAHMTAVFVDKLQIKQKSFKRKLNRSKLSHRVLLSMQHTLQIYFANNASVYKLRQLNYHFKKYKKTEILRKTYNSILVNSINALILTNKNLII